MRRHYYFKKSKQQNIVKSYAKKAKNEYLFKKKKYFILQGDILKTCENNKKRTLTRRREVRKNKHIEKKIKEKKTLFTMKKMKKISIIL